MEASKWLDLQLLISATEMQQLFHEVAPFQIYLTGRVLPQPQISPEEFLEAYAHYCQAIIEGEDPQASPLFSCIWTLSSDVLKVIKVDESRQLVQLQRPAVQLQPHAMAYSQYDGKFHSMSYGKGSILWGLQFSYPQLFLEPETGDIRKVDSEFPNTLLFRKIQRWVRAETIPTPMQTPTGFINLSVRLGKQCLSWINQHSQLKTNQLFCGKPSAPC